MRIYFTLILAFTCVQLIAQFDGPKLLLGSEEESDREFFDFDNDGYIDVLTSNTEYTIANKGIIQLNRQSNEGAFNYFEVLAVHGWPNWSYSMMEVHDFDADGFMDIVLYGELGLVIYRNNAGSSLDLMFETYLESSPPLGSVYGPKLSIEDFNGDGFLDLCGGFYNVFAYSLGSINTWEFGDLNTIELELFGEVIDLNFDGHLDVIGSTLEGLETAYMNYGNGELIEDAIAASLVPHGYGQLIDIDGDNLLDAINYQTQEMSAFFNLGNGNFEYVSIAESNENSQGQLCDFDLDGDVDVIYYTWGNEFIETYVAYFDQGQFLSIQTEMPISNSELEFFDYNNDGYMDILMPERDWNSSRAGVYSLQGESWLWHCDFASGLTLVNEPYYEMMNSMMTAEGNIIHIDQTEDGRVMQLHYESFTNDDVIWSSEFRDLNNDLAVDFLFLSYMGNGQHSLNAAYGSTLGWQIFEIWAGTYAWFPNNASTNPFIDFNQDGLIDFAFSTENEFAVYVNNGDQSFSPFVPESLALDFNVVNIADEQRVFVNTSTAENIELNELNGDGTWTLHSMPNEFLNLSFEYLFCGDYNFDGELDIFACGESGEAFISQAFNSPEMVWQSIAENYTGTRLPEPLFMNGSWKFVAKYLINQPILEVATGEEWFQPGLMDVDLMPFEFIDVDHDLDIDLAYKYIDGQGIVWFENLESGSVEIEVVIFVDENQNGVYEATENVVNVGEVECMTDNPYWSMSSSNGSLSYHVVGNEVSMTHSINETLWQHTTNNQITLTINESSEMIYFGIQPIGEVPHCTTSLSLSNDLCNVESILYLNVTNTGNVAVVCAGSAQIHSWFTYLSANATPTIAGNSYTFDVGLLEVGETVQIEIHLLNPSEQFLNGEFLFPTYSKTYFDDLWAIHEFDYFNGIITCAYDPNDKTELNTLFTDHLYEIGQGLEYQVRFQNTGNAPATNIHIVDQLSSNLDRSTFQMLDASHDYYYSLSSTGELIVYFDNIMLADSFNNEVESHGYFKYSIQPIYTEEPGQTVYNTAYIYFDENPAVITNTTYNAIQIIGVEEYGFDGLGVSLFPNPNQGSFTIQTDEGGPWDLAIYDLYGKLVHPESFSGESKAIQTDLAEGVYIVKLRHRASNEVLLTRFICVH